MNCRAVDIAGGICSARDSGEFDHVESEHFARLGVICTEKKREGSLYLQTIKTVALESGGTGLLDVGLNGKQEWSW